MEAFTMKSFHEYSLEEIFFELGIYNEIELDLATPKEVSYTIGADVGGPGSSRSVPTDVKIRKSDDFNRVLSVLFNGKIESKDKDKVYHLCPTCGIQNSFVVESGTGLDLSSYEPFKTNSSTATRDEYREMVNSYAKNRLEKMIETLFAGKSLRYRSVTIKCTYNEEHRFDFYFLLKRETCEDGSKFYFAKVGQYPSFADFKVIETIKYRSILKSLNFESEYKRAQGLYSAGIGIGAFVYLRRILEALVLQAFEKAQTENVISQDEYEYDEIKEAHSDEKRKKRRTFESKIRLLKDYLPKMLVDNAYTYGIISKGLHELTEDECITYFPALLKGIELILEQMHHIREKERLENEVQKEMNKIKTAMNTKT